LVPTLNCTGRRLSWRTGRSPNRAGSNRACSTPSRAAAPKVLQNPHRSRLDQPQGINDELHHDPAADAGVQHHHREGKPGPHQQLGPDEPHVAGLGPIEQLPGGVVEQTVHRSGAAHHAPTHAAFLSPAGEVARINGLLIEIHRWNAGGDLHDRSDHLEAPGRGIAGDDDLGRVGACRRRRILGLDLGQAGQEQQGGVHRAVHRQRGHRPGTENAQGDQPGVKDRGGEILEQASLRTGSRGQQHIQHGRLLMRSLAPRMVPPP